MQNKMPIMSSLWPSTPWKNTLERSGSLRLASPLTCSGCAIAVMLRPKKEISSEADFSKREHAMLESKLRMGVPPIYENDYDYAFRTDFLG
jgi:hypothetical protein